MAVREAYRAPDGKLHGDAGAGDWVGGSVPGQSQRPDARFRAYLRNSLPNDTDILHEYFIPRSQFVSFVDGMRKVLTDNKTNLLNASVRVVHQENNFLTYSPEPAFSLVLYLTQTTDDEGNRRMKKATEELIDLTIAHKGRFFLPYQLYYSRDQLQRSYPQINEFFAAKRKYDPTELFTNTFYQKYAS